MVTCADFEKEPDFPGCCISCHEDADEYGYDLPTVPGDDLLNPTSRVCCYISNWLTLIWLPRATPRKDTP